MRAPNERAVDGGRCDETVQPDETSSLDAAVLRAFAIAIAAFVTGFGSALVALIVQHAAGAAEPSASCGADAACVLPLHEFLCASFVRAIALSLAFVGSVVGAAIALLLLWRTRLELSLPIVAGMTITSSAMFACWGPLGMLATLVVGVLTMLVCRACWPHEERRRRRERAAER